MTPPTTSQEAREFALSILRDPVYQQNFISAARNRLLPPAVEIALMHYAWGKPTERVELGRPGSFDALTPTELAARARELASTLEMELLTSPLPEESEVVVS